MKNTLIALVILIIIGLGGYYVYTQMQASQLNTQGKTDQQQATTTATSTTPAVLQPQQVIGKSVNGYPIVAYHFGNGAKEILFVGGIHGGYEWNTALVAFDLIQYLQQHPEAVPANETVTVIPVLNPDGLQKVVGTTTAFTAADVNPSQTVQVSGRFNGDNVDLNRNFACDWQASGTWQNKTVSGGTAAFSEPESGAIEQYVQAHKPTAVVVWYSSAGGVFASNCHAGVLPETSTLMNVFAQASGYPAHQTFDYYAVTGDMTNWLAKIGIPAISVLLTNHTDVEWTKNLAGVQAILQHYAQ